MSLQTRVYRTVYRLEVGNGGFRSHPSEVGQTAPSEEIKPVSPREHPVTLTNSADLTSPQPVVPSHSSILGLEHPL
jgi:hypothetical protein